MLSKTLLHLLATAATTATLFTISSAQSTTTSSSAQSTTPSAVAAVAPAGANGYTYIGCYNETTGITGTGGARALANGKMEADETMTIELCTSFCGGTQYAGLEYSDECWCAPYLSSLSTQLDASECDLSCKGNDTEICGGSLTISLYNLTGKSGSSSGGGSGGSSGKGSGAATVALSWTLGVGALVVALGGGLLR